MIFLWFYRYLKMYIPLLFQLQIVLSRIVPTSAIGFRTLFLWLLPYSFGLLKASLVLTSIWLLLYFGPFLSLIHI